MSAFLSVLYGIAAYVLFSIATTGYILVGIWLEERDLVAQFGDRYRRYREHAGMLLPRPGRRGRLRPPLEKSS